MCSGPPGPSSWPPPGSAHDAGVDVSEHGEEADHAGDIGELAGRRVPLGQSVLLPASDIRGPTVVASAPTTSAAT